MNQTQLKNAITEMAYPMLPRSEAKDFATEISKGRYVNALRSYFNFAETTEYRIACMLRLAPNNVERLKLLRQILSTNVND